MTDDGQFLILLATGPVFESALRVYRKGDDSSDRMQDGTVKGVLVKTSNSKNFGPQQKLT